MMKNTKCLIGFDGYVDEMYAVVRKRIDSQHYEPYDTIAKWGERIMLSAGKSADIEICQSQVRFGGNGPILANAMASLGFETTCIGKMDWEGEANPFSRMKENCTKISTGPASKTIALEFQDGKIMLGNLRGNQIGWQEIREIVTPKRLRSLLRESRLIAMVNWGGMFRMNEIMEGIWQELMALPKDLRAEKELFFDPADPTGRTREEFDVLFSLLPKMSAEFRMHVA